MRLHPRKLEVSWQYLIIVGYYLKALETVSGKFLGSREVKKVRKRTQITFKSLKKIWLG